MCSSLQGHVSTILSKCFIPKTITNECSAHWLGRPCLLPVTRVRNPLTQYTSFFLQIQLRCRSQYKYNLTNQSSANEVIAQWLLLCSSSPQSLFDSRSVHVILVFFFVLFFSFYLSQARKMLFWFSFLYCFFPFIYHKRASGRLLFWFSFFLFFYLYFFW